MCDGYRNGGVDGRPDEVKQWLPNNNNVSARYGNAFVRRPPARGGVARLALHNARPPPGVGVNIVFHDDDCGLGGRDEVVFEAVVALLGDDAVLLGPARRPPPALPHHRHGLRQEVRHSIVSRQSVLRCTMFRMFYFGMVDIDTSIGYCFQSQVRAFNYV